MCAAGPRDAKLVFRFDARIPRDGKLFIVFVSVLIFVVVLAFFCFMVGLSFDFTGLVLGLMLVS